MSKSNFEFLKEWQDLFQRAQKAESLVITDPRTSLSYARMALELAVLWMYRNDSNLELPFDTSLNSLIKQEEFKNLFHTKFYCEIDSIRAMGNLAIHNKAVGVQDSEKIITHLFYFTKWFAKTYALNDVELYKVFDWEIIPHEGPESLNKKQLAALQLKFTDELSNFKKVLKDTEEKNKKLLEENELQRLRIAELQAKFDANKLEANKLNENTVLHPRNEYETRKFLIDVSLREAGWDLSGANVKEYEVDNMPKSTNPSGKGYVDYVLWDDNGKPLAVVEAKKTLEAVAKGENQAQLYAECLEQKFGVRPVMYYTNGYEIYLWDDIFYKQSRLVQGFYTKQELQTLMFRRQNRSDIRRALIDDQIAGRAYQMRAIKSITEHFAGTDKQTGKLIGTNRKALLVLATGTGKTRTAIAFSKLLLECNWAKRILFLADRKSLVRQAKSNFVKLLRNHQSVNLLEEKDNPDARIAFSTYQTMMGLIDGSRTGEERFYGVGHFDLVIVDEAHRSIYQKYQSIFKYFDALYLGLTATPKSKIDKNTYEVFGLPDKSPTDAYTFEEAVENKHLVPYKTIVIKTKFTTKGIKYAELTDEEKEQFEQEILDGEEANENEVIDPTELNKWLFNKDTTLKILSKIVELGIKKRGGEELGKTIIFARNKKHAAYLKEQFMTLDKELYGNEYVKVITHGEPKAEEFIERFCDEEKERLPQICISVDMMDTGIDAPSCVNLVFYKPVKSYAKFWQMVGRGSRLRQNLFGPGMDKTHFLIFDLYGNFEFFDENPHGIEGEVQKSLSEIVFAIKLQLAIYLGDGKFKLVDDLQKYRAELLDALHHEIKSLDTTRFEVKMKLQTVMDYGGSNRELWNNLNKKDIKIITDELAPLVKPKKEDSDLARFYDKLLYSLMIKRIETPTTKEFVNEFKIPITKVAILSKRLLKKTSIPEVEQQRNIIELPLAEKFWENDGIHHLEKIRVGLRHLIKYIDFNDQKFVTSNFEDELYDVENFEMIDATDNITEYNTVFKNNIYRLQEIVRNHKDHIIISRIRKGEKITMEELVVLEKMLFSSNLNKDEVIKELGKSFDLVQFIIQLVGLSEEKVDKAFADFINEFELNSVQIEFLEMIKKFFLENGKIDPNKLFDSPFKKYHPLGIEGVFNDQQTTKILKIIEEINPESGLSA